jgi:hypothetical protein
MMEDMLHTVKQRRQGYTIRICWPQVMPNQGQTKVALPPLPCVLTPTLLTCPDTVAELCVLKGIPLLTCSCCSTR